MRICKALLEFFLWIFSSLTCLKKLVFNKQDLLRWKVPARLYWDLLTSRRYHPAWNILKRSQNPSSALHRKRTLVQALLWFSACSLGLPALGTDLKSRKGLYSGAYVIFGLFSRPTGLVHRSQITKGPVLRPFSYTEISPMLFFSGGNKKLKHKIGIFHWRCLVFKSLKNEGNFYFSNKSSHFSTAPKVCSHFAAVWRTLFLRTVTNKC